MNKRQARGKELVEYAVGTLIEQHDNKEKCHTYFYTKDRPMTSKIANEEHDEDDPAITKPQIEIKSNGSALMNCTPSPHKDGSKLRFLGTRKILTVDADTIEDRIDEICGRYGIPYLSRRRDGPSLDLPPIQSVIDSDKKIYAGENRQLYLLRYLDSKKIKNPELGFESLLALARDFGLKHFDVQYPEKIMEQKVKEALKFGTRVLIDKIEKERKNNIDALKDDATYLEELNDITNPKHTDKLIRVKCIVASNLIPYNVPHVISAECTSTKKSHSEVHNNLVDIKRDITLTEKSLPQFVDANTTFRYKTLSFIAQGYFSGDCEIEVTEKSTMTINKMKIRPIMHSLIFDGKEFLDNKGNKYISYDIYIIQKDVDINLTAGKEIEIIGYVMADPRNSKTTIMALDVKELDENKFEKEKIKEIQKYHENKKPSEIVGWHAEEFSKYCRIVKRENVIIAVMLNLFSSLGFGFEGKTIRGWLNSVIMGDSTTGKSQIVKDAIKSLRAGQIASGEMASVAGIAGAAVQTSGGQWFTDYGLLPLQDRKALWLDGAHKIPKEEMDRLAEAERNGKIEINKASKGEAWARTRQGKIMNPLNDERRDTTTMNNFIYPVQALTNSFQLQSIARIDLAIFVLDDVVSKDRNKPMNEKHDPILDNYGHLLRLIWSNQHTIIFEEGVMDRILDGASILEDKFKTDEIPLITNDQKYKLAKLSIALAGFTASFNDDYTQLIIKKEHVDFIVNFITKEYTAAGLAEIKKQGTFGEINIKILYETVDKINDKIKNDDENYETATNIIKWISTQRKFTKDELKDEFNLSRDKQLSPLVTYLSNYNLIKKLRNGFITTKKSIALTKYILNNTKNINQLLQDQHNKLIRTFECEGCGTKWKYTRDTQEMIAKDHSCIAGVKIVDITDE